MPPGCAKRHAKKGLLSSENIAKPAIRRLARRGGVKRIGTGVYEEMRRNIRAFVKSTLADATKFTEHARRKTVTVQDMIEALKHQGAQMYV